MNAPQQDQQSPNIPPPTLLPAQADDAPFAAPREHGYYTSAGRKWGDFAIGFFGSIAVNVVTQLITSMIISTYSNASQYSIGASISTEINYRGVGLLVTFILSIVAIVYAFKRRRRFIAIGMIATACLPFLFLGGCLLIIAAGSYHF